MIMNRQLKWILVWILPPVTALMLALIFLNRTLTISNSAGRRFIKWRIEVNLIVLNCWLNSTDVDIQDQVPPLQAHLLCQCRGLDQGRGEVPRVSRSLAVSPALGGCQCPTAGSLRVGGERRREGE